MLYVLCDIRCIYAYFPAGNYVLKVENTDTRTRCEVFSKLTSVVLVSLLLTLNIFHIFLHFFSIVNFEQVNANWVAFKIKDRENFENQETLWTSLSQLLFHVKRTMKLIGSGLKICCLHGSCQNYLYAASIQLCQVKHVKLSFAIFLFRGFNKNTTRRCELWSNKIIKTLK